MIIHQKVERVDAKEETDSMIKCQYHIYTIKNVFYRKHPLHKTTHNAWASIDNDSKYLN